MSPRGRTGVLTIAVLLAGAHSVAAEGTISGIVRDGKEPAAFANVAVLGTRRGAQTAEDGRYTIMNVPAGRYANKASLPGRTLVGGDFDRKRPEFERWLKHVSTAEP